METHAVHKFDQYAEKEDWKSAYEMIPELVRTSPDDVEVWVRILYTLHNIIVEEGPTKLGLTVAENQLEQELLNYFRQANEKFADNAEYLFFMGVIGHISEWYWGEDDDEFATKMSEKAFLLDPHNKLYELQTIDPTRRKSDCEHMVLLTQEILKDTEQKKWLEEKGFPGKYILRGLEFRSTYRCTDEGLLYSTLEKKVGAGRYKEK